MMNEEIAGKSLEVGFRIANLSLDLILKGLEFIKEKLDDEQSKQSKTPEIPNLNHTEANPKVKEGQMTLKELQKQGGGLSTVELEKPHLRTLKNTLKKHGVDFSVVKDGKGQYTLFFKGKDADSMAHAFKQYTRQMVKMENSNKPSINKTLTAAKKLAQSLNSGRDKEKTKSRGAR